MFRTERDWKRGFVVEEGPGLRLLKSLIHPRRTIKELKEEDRVNEDIKYIRQVHQRSFFNIHAQEEMDQITKQIGKDTVRAVTAPRKRWE